MKLTRRQRRHRVGEHQQERESEMIFLNQEHHGGGNHGGRESHGQRTTGNWFVRNSDIEIVMFTPMMASFMMWERWTHLF